MATSHNGSSQKDAPGAPGVKPTWSPGAKSGVGCALSAQSRLWFTLGRGIVNEVYYPRIDLAAIRDFELIITGAGGFFSEEQKDCASDTRMTAAGVPAYEIENVCKDGRYRIAKDIIADPHRSVLLQRVKFSASKGSIRDYRLFALLSPRLGDQGHDNSAWVESHRGREMLFARHDGHSLALACSSRWVSRAVGYVGRSDPWQDLRQNGRLTWNYQRATHGHVAVAGEIDLMACGGEFLLVLSFGESTGEAAINAMLSLFKPFADARDQYVHRWGEWNKQFRALHKGEVSANNGGQQRNRPDRSRPRVLEKRLTDSSTVFQTSMMVLRAHRSKHVAGGGLASLAVPWGEVRGDANGGGYHLVWPRDLCEEAMGLLAGGAFEDVVATLNYLRATQKPEGGWPQDMWLDGSPHGHGVQLDEAALPILLLGLAYNEKALKRSELESFWPMVRSAAGFVIQSGPATQEDRWENTTGLSPYTIATEISALLIAARLADQFGDKKTGEYFYQTADLWNDLIESWTYVTGTELARRVGVDGYYVRIAPSPGMLTIMRRGEKPRMEQAHNLLYEEVVSPDALALVRFGLRAADDPRILNTVKVVDAVTRVELPAGPCWHRYNGDYYGEYDDGAPFGGHDDSGGTGRAWPLLTGERGHYELATGNAGRARKMLQTMAGFASQIGLLPEQVWDTADLPKRDLFRGRASGSAMPLVWAHSEYVRLLRSIRDRKVFDRPADAWRRYVKSAAPRSSLALWRFDHQVDSFFAGRRLRIEVMAPALVRFSLNEWKTVAEVKTSDTGLGLHYADLPTERMNVGERFRFTLQWPNAGNRWEGKNFELEVEASGSDVAVARPKRKRDLSTVGSHG